jgi:hypothetical protein
MRNIYASLAVSLMMGCAGSDGKDGRDGAPGADGPAGMNGMNGADGDDGAPGSKGEDGADGPAGMNGMNGADGDDGSGILQGAGAPTAGLGVDGDVYIDTVTRDVYQKSNGTWSVITNLSGGPAGPKGDPGDTGADGVDGASVRTGSGVPAAGLGNVGDVYIDSTTGDLYAKDAGGWTKTGSLKGPAGADGLDGVDVDDTLQGVRWFAFAMNAAFVDTPSLLTSQTYTDVSSSASFTFTGANQHGRLAFQTAGSYLPSGVDLSAFESMDLSVSVSGGAVNGLALHMADGALKGCQWDLVPAAGPVYSIDLSSPSSCYDDSLDGAFALDSVTMIQIGIVSSGANSRSITVTDIDLLDSQ